MPRKSSKKTAPMVEQASADIDEAIYMMIEVRALILTLGDSEMNLLADLLLYRIGQIGAQSLACFDPVAGDQRAA